MARDIHKELFDEGTKAKLAIFRDYLRKWLPVFLSKKDIYWETINIYDFFAGPGSDTGGTEGTPLIIIEELAPYVDKIVSKKLTVNLYFNEFNKQKCSILKSRILPKDEDLKPYSIQIDSLDFKEAFEKMYPSMKGHANLLFLDQTGVKHINEETFCKIINLKTTDFLFFISSSTIKRFSEHPSIVQYIKLKNEIVDKTPYHKIHRLVLEYYRSLIPENKEFYLSSFSLKKGAGLYGLIFGSGHVLGMEKFLTACWSLDKERGEANFDIDDDRIIPGTLDLFTQQPTKPKKVDFFERELKEQILAKKLLSDQDIYLFTLLNGFLPKHSRNVIKSLINKKKLKNITFDLSSNVCKLRSKVTQIELL